MYVKIRLTFVSGKSYQEERGGKRERRQPMSIPNLPYLTWEKTGQPPAGPYAVRKHKTKIIFEFRVKVKGNVNFERMMK